MSSLGSTSDGEPPVPDVTSEVRAWTRATAKQCLAHPANIPALVAEGTVRRLVPYLRASPEEHEQVVVDVSAALRHVCAVPCNAPVLHEALLASGLGGYGAFVDLVESSHEKVVSNALACLASACRHEAPCCAVLGTEGLGATLHRLVERMTFPKRMAFRKNIAIHRALSNLVSASTATTSISGCWDGAWRLRDTGILALHVELLRPGLVVQGAAGLASVCRVLQSLELATEDAEAAKHLCRGVNLSPLKRLAQLCGQTPALSSSAAVEDDQGGAGTDSDVGRPMANALELRAFTSAFRVLRNLAVHAAPEMVGPIAPAPTPPPAVLATKSSLRRFSLKGGSLARMAAAARRGVEVGAHSGPFADTVRVLCRWVVRELAYPADSCMLCIDHTGELSRDVVVELLWLMASAKYAGLPSVSPGSELEDFVEDLQSSQQRSGDRDSDDGDAGALENL